MPFDPKAYLAQNDAPEQKPSGGFDPKAYLSGDSAAPKSDDSTLKQIDQMNESGDTSNDALFNMLSFGHLPQIKAKAQQIFSGGGISNDDNYVKLRDAEVKAEKAREEKYPWAHREGTVAGAIAPMLVTGGASAAPQSLAMATGKAVATGAAMGAAQNPGDTEGEVDPLQVGARVKNAAVGGILGGTVGLAARALPKAADALGNYAEKKAYKSSGAMLKDARVDVNKDNVNEIGRHMLDSGLVKAGDSVEGIAEKANAAKSEAGAKLGAIYDKAQASMGALPEEAQAAVNSVGFNPARDKGEIMSAAKEALGHHVDRKSAMSKLGNYLDDLAEEHGDKVLDPRIANDIKSSLQSKISYSRNPLNPDPATEVAMDEAQRLINGKIKAHVGALGNAAGDTNLAAELASANHDYGMVKHIANMSQDRATREATNRALGLTDTISAGAGATVGAKAGMFIAGPAGAVAGGLAGGAAGGIANKVGRTYGASTVAAGADSMSKFLSQSPKLAELAKTNPAAYEALVGQMKNRIGNMTPSVAGSDAPRSVSMIPESPESSKQKFIDGN